MATLQSCISNVTDYMDYWNCSISGFYESMIALYSHFFKEVIKWPVQVQLKGQKWGLPWNECCFCAGLLCRSHWEAEISLGYPFIKIWLLISLACGARRQRLLETQQSHMTMHYEFHQLTVAKEWVLSVPCLHEKVRNCLLLSAGKDT